MQNNVEPASQSQLDAVFAQLSPQAVEEFYAAYQQWSLHQRINELRQRIETVRAQQAENEQRLREAQPSAIAFAALARLQSNGVSDIALLDAMLERGESWLDQTMQRLDYFEQFDDFISDDYTKWCQGALEGAFDWIDSLRDGTAQGSPEQVEPPPDESPSSSEEVAEVEALFLQRLATEHVDDLEWQEAITLKRPAIQPQVSEVVNDESVEEEQPAPEGDARENTEVQAQAAEYIPQDGPDQNDETGITPGADSPAGAEEQILLEEASPVEESALSASEPDQPALIEFAPVEEVPPDEEMPHTEDEEPPLIESAPVDESPATDELPIGDEEPTLVEFVANPPSEVSSPEEPSDQDAEQAEPFEASQEEETSNQQIEQAAPEEVPVLEEVSANEDTAEIEAIEPGEQQELEQGNPEDVPTHEDITDSEINQSDEQGKPQELEQNPPEETVPHEEETPVSSQMSRPIRGNPRKGGLMRRLIRLVAGI